MEIFQPFGETKSVDQRTRPDYCNGQQIVSTFDKLKSSMIFSSCL